MNKKESDDNNTKKLIFMYLLLLAILSPFMVSKILDSDKGIGELVWNAIPRSVVMPYDAGVVKFYSQESVTNGNGFKQKTENVTLD